MPHATPTKAERATLVRLRLAAQLITPAKPRDPADVVRHMVAMQAQDLAAARWAVASRAGGATVNAIDAALNSGAIVRSWPLRGTLHFTAPDDLRWIMALTAERTLHSARTTLAREGVTPAMVGRAEAVARGALAGGRALSRDGLRELFAEHGVIAPGQRSYHLLWYLAQSGTLCLGPVSSRGQDFVLLDEWIAPSPTLERDEALGELAHRYFVSHGPSTVRNLAWWASLTLTDARRGLEIARPRLATLEIAGTEYFADHAVVEASPARWQLRLLPGFDELLFGYQDRSAVLDPRNAPAVFPSKNGTFRAIIVQRGEVVGTWTRSISARAGTVDVALQPFDSMTASERSAATRQAEQYAAHLGLSPGTITGADSVGGASKA